MRKPIEDICQSGLFGPWDKPDLGEMPAGLNPAKCDPWGLDSFQLFPNFVVLFWGQGWYLTYHYWPTSYNTHVFEGTLYFPQPRTPRERVAQELAAVSFKEYGLQDANTLEATQTMIESRVIDRFVLNDQEILLRHLHKETAAWIDEYRRTPTRECEFGVRLAANRIRRAGSIRRLVPAQRTGALCQRLASSMTEMKAFYDAITPRAEEAITYCDKFFSTTCPRMSRTSCTCCIR